MSTHSSQEAVLGSNDVARLERVAPIGLLVGILGIVASGIFFATGNQVAVTGSWLFGWYFWFTITIGMFGISILHHTLRGRWSVALLRLLEGGGGPVSLAVMAALFIPILLNRSVLYEWANPAQVAKDSILQFKQPFLNTPFWVGRFVVLFGIWITFAWFMKNSERTQEKTVGSLEAGDGVHPLEKGRSSWGAVGMVMFFLTVSCGIIDWVMSLEPHWSSTMLPLWQIIGSCLGAMSFCVATVCINAKKDPYPSILSPDLTKDWGNLLFMFTMLWAYTALSQFLIIWNGNLPETAQYFARRSFMQWNALGMVTIVGQFLVPWMSLLSPRVKRYPRLLRKIAGWIFVIHIVDVYVAIGPALPTGGANWERRPAFGASLLYDLCAWLAVGGIWLWVFGTQVKQAPLLVGYDQRIQESLAHAH